MNAHTLLHGYWEILGKIKSCCYRRSALGSPGNDGFSVTKVTVGVVGVVGADITFLVAMGAEPGPFDSMRVRMGVPSTILNNRESNTHL